MRSKKTYGLLGLLALVIAGLYWFRRQLVGRWMGLRPVRYAVTVRHGLRINTPDGAELATDHYTPEGKRLFPTILVRTPYGRNASAGPVGVLSAFLAERFAERGYNVLVQDVRGRFDSGNDFDPFRYETADGHATLAWIEEQPWFNGVLGMWGASYLGYVQWAVTPGAPLFLKAMMPVFSGSRLPVAGIRDGAFATDTILRWIQTLETMQRLNGLPGWLKSAGQTLLQDRQITRAVAHLPLVEADQVITGHPVPFFRTWLAHPDVDDPYWVPVDRSPQVAQTTAAVHLMGGWYDILLRQTLDDYLALIAASQQPYLTIGPWAHLDQEGLWESVRQGIAWFDASLKGDRRWLRKKAVRIFVMGTDQWRELNHWPPEAAPQRFYLQQGNQLLPVTPPDDSPPDQYAYDPQHPTPAVGGSLMSQHAGRRDNRSLERRPDVLTYTTQALEYDLEIIGPLRVDLYLTSSLEHADFFARLCDVTPTKRSFNVCDGLLRIEPGSGERLSDGTLHIEIELGPTAYCFRHGHSLRLQLSSGAHPRWNRNPGTGEPLSIAARLVAAKQTIFHDKAHPSALVLPIIKQEIP
jgi:uncharacterized protein